MQFYCQNTIWPKKDTKLCLRVKKWSRSDEGNTLLFYFLESSKESNVYPRNIHTTWQWTHSGKRLRMCEIVCWWRKHMAQIESWKNKIWFFTGFKKIKQQRISFILGYLLMILWKISTAISIKHWILAT
jgi:hypothetical protein